MKTFQNSISLISHARMLTFIHFSNTFQQDKNPTHKINNCMCLKTHTWLSKP